MTRRVAVVGAGVSGLTTGIVLAEAGCEVSLFADEVNQQTTSAVAGAMWFPYDAEPAERVIPLALETYRELAHLTSDPGSGVSMIELQQFGREHEIDVPDWACSLGAKVIAPDHSFKSGFSINVPLTDTTIYLDYLQNRLGKAGGTLEGGIRFSNLAEVERKFALVINCAGFGAKRLVNDPDLEPHRGQVAIVPKMENVGGAIVCDDAPLMYVIPRANDCLFGGTNEISDDRTIDPATTTGIVTECCRVLGIPLPKILGERAGLRPFRKSGVRLERGRLGDGRVVIHNYGHGGAGFTLSWGCAREVLKLVT